MSETPAVFLSYAKEDYAKVRVLYDALIRNGINVWFDKENLTDGRWKGKIVSAITKSTFFVPCISSNALRKSAKGIGFQTKELDIAFQIALEQPEEAFCIVPLRLEECSRGDNRISMFHQYDLFLDFDGVISSLTKLFKRNSDPEVHNIADIPLGLTKEALFGRGQAQYYAGDYSAAYEDFSNAERHYGHDFDIMMARASTLFELNRDIEALNELNKATMIDPANPLVWYNLGCAYMKLGRWEEAQAAALTGITKKFPLCYHLMGKIMNNVGEYEKAIHYLSQIGMEKEDDIAMLLYDMGVAYSGLDKDDIAMEFFENALTFNDHLLYAWQNKGVLHKAKKEYEEALLAYDEGLKRNPEDFNLLRNKGALLSDLNRNEEAIECFDKILSINSTHAEALNNKGVVLARMGRLQESYTSINAACEANKNYGDAWRNKASILMDLEDVKGATEAINRAFELQPNNPMVNLLRDKILEIRYNTYISS